MVNPVISSGHSGLNYNFLENWAHEDILNYTGYSNPRPIYILNALSYCMMQLEFQSFKASGKGFKPNLFLQQREK